MAVFTPKPGSPVGVNDPFRVVLPIHPLTGRVPSTGIEGNLLGKASWTPGAVAAGAVVTTTVTVTGARVGDRVDSSFAPLVPNGLASFGFVSLADTVTLQMTNISAASITPGVFTVSVGVHPQGLIVRNDGS